MIKYLILFISFSAISSEYELDVSHNYVDHAWRGRDVANYSANLKGLGLTYWHNSNFGLRVSHLFGEKMYTKGMYKHIYIDLKSITSIHLQYRIFVNDDLMLLSGFGTSVIPVPAYRVSDDALVKKDYDNDEGYFFGVQYKLNKKTSISWRFTHYSRIKKTNISDEWLKAHSFNLSYIF